MMALWIALLFSVTAVMTILAGQLLAYLPDGPSPVRCIVSSMAAGLLQAGFAICWYALSITTPCS